MIQLDTVEDELQARINEQVNEILIENSEEIKKLYDIIAQLQIDLEALNEKVNNFHP